jgi:hypothetical protein
MIEFFTVVIFAQICYHEAQVTKATCPLHSFVGHLPEPWERPLVRKAATRFGKSPAGIIRLLVNDIFHENHKA